MDGPVDLLFDIKNAFYVGNYQTCAREAESFNADSDELAEQCKILMYRSMIAQKKYAVVRGDISSDASSALQAVKMLANYSHAPSDAILEEAKKMQGDGISLTNPTVALMLATIFFNANNTDDALRCLHAVDTLEAMALNVQILLHINRVDLAKKQLKKMQEKDDDSTLTQLASAWVNLSVGGDKLQDTLYIMQDLGDKFSHTPLLLNAKASTLMMQGKYIEAEEALLQAQEKDANNAATLINLFVVSNHLARGKDVSQRYLNQLKDSEANHPFIQGLNEKDALFTKLIQEN